MDQGKKPRRWRRALGAGTCVLCGVMLIAGCRMGARKPPPLEAPRAEFASAHYVGSALTGPQARKLDDAQIERSWLVEARVLATDVSRFEGFDRIGEQARLIIATRGGAPAAPSSRLTAQLLWRPLDAQDDFDAIVAKDRRALLSDSVLAVAPGSTVEWHIRNDQTTQENVTASADAPVPPLPATLIVRISRGADANVYELSLLVRQAVPLESNEPPPPVQEDLIVPPPPPKVRTEEQEEMLVVDRTIDATKRLVLVAPMRFAGSEASHVVVDLSIVTYPADDDRRAQALEALRAGALKSADDVAQRVAMTSAGADDLAIASALGALSQAGDEPRGALAYLADQCDAGLTREVVLVADQPLLQLLAKSVSERAAGLARRDKPNIGWLLERTTVAALAAMAGDEKHPITPAVEGALLTYAGEVGRQLDALQSLVGRANGIADLRNRLVSEHLLYLEDNSPGARVRAYDWLVAWHSAPQGYDPLDTARNRRAALQRAAQPQDSAAPATQPTTRPATQPTTQPDQAS